tara:strand:- start:410 stop:790 length:381 start_codon:yes stop_codon:yes gene_type:complete
MKYKLEWLRYGRTKYRRVDIPEKVFDYAKKVWPKYVVDKMKKEKDASDIVSVIIEEARNTWHLTWKRNGSIDEGTCTVGCAIKTPYGSIYNTWVQGSLSSDVGSKEAVEYLKSFDIDAYYDEGSIN